MRQRREAQWLTPEEVRRWLASRRDEALREALGADLDAAEVWVERIRVRVSALPRAEPHDHEESHEAPHEETPEARRDAAEGETLETRGLPTGSGRHERWRPLRVERFRFKPTPRRLSTCSSMGSHSRSTADLWVRDMPDNLERREGPLCVPRTPCDLRIVANGGPVDVGSERMVSWSLDRLGPRADRGCSRRGIGSGRDVPLAARGLDPPSRG